MRQHYETDDPRPAPGALALIQDFANAHFAEARQPDRERRMETVAAWAQRHGLLPRGQRLAPAERGRILELRAAVRALIAANEGEGRPPAGAVRALNAAAAAAPLRVSFVEGAAAELAPAAGGANGVVATILGIIAGAMRDGTWARLKLCADDDCRWAFYDRSRNRAGAWCSMASCGNRAKARAYRTRRRG